MNRFTTRRTLVFLIAISLMLQIKILIYIAIDMTPTRAKNDGFALNKVKNGPNSP